MFVKGIKIVGLSGVFLILLAVAGCRNVAEVGELQIQSESVEIGDAESVKVEIEMGAGELVVAGGASDLLEATFTYNVDEMEPQVAYKGGNLSVGHADVDVNLWDMDEFRNEWELRFNENVPMELMIDLGAGQGEFQLGDLALSSLIINAGAGDVTVDLTGAPTLSQLDLKIGAGELLVDLTGDWTNDLNAGIKAGIGEMTLRLPGSVGVQVDVKKGIGKVNSTNLTRDGDTYVNDAFGKSEVTLRFDIETGVGEINLEGEPAPTVTEPAPPSEEPAGEEEAQEEEVAIADEAITTQMQAALQGLLDDQVQEQEIPGLAMVIRAADGTVTGKGSGFTDSAGENAWTVDTQSALGSITKSFTAVVIMQLIEEDKLSLDDTIDSWFPELPNGDRITVRMLLSHTSGLANYISAENVLEGKWTTEWAPMDLVTEATKSGPVSEPGSSDAHYANTNYILLGMIIEEITGHSWAREVESRIIQPLDLKDTTFLSAEGVWGGTMVDGYAETPDGKVSTLDLPWYPHSSSIWSAGELVGTPSDLMTFASGLFNGDLVSKETLAVMAQAVGTDVNSGIIWGLGGGTMAGLPPGAFGMGGDIPGYHAFFLGFLDSNLAVTAMVNTEEADVIGPSIAAIQYLTAPQQGQQDPDTSGVVYQDPEGRFSMTIVGEWTPVETDGTYDQFAYADMPIYMSLVTVETDDLEAGVDAALRQVGVDPAALTEINRAPWDKWDLFYYSLGDGQGVTVLGQESDGTSYFIVATGEEALTANPPEDILKTVQGFSLTGSGGDSLPVTVEEFEAYVNSFAGTRPPGLSMAIGMREDLLYEQGFGLADGPQEIPAVADTVYHWGSVTKVVTAIAIMQLREQGLIDLDAPVSDYLDYFPAEYPVTVRHLLTHSSGLPEPADFLMVNLRHQGQALPDFDRVDREFYEGVSNLMFEPGSQSAYINPDFVTLGQVVAAVSGQPYVDYVHEHILNPLGMENTDFTYSNEFLEANAAAPAIPIAEAEALVPLLDEARGLGDGADFIRETGENYTWMNHYIVGESAGGGLMGPASDMIRLAQMMLNNGELDGVRILAPDSVALFQEVQRATSGEPLGIGLAWHFGDDVEHPYIEHDGGGQGIAAKLRLYMKDGFAIAIMANGSGFDRNELADAAANVVFSMMGQ